MRLSILLGLLCVPALLAQRSSQAQQDRAPSTRPGLAYIALPGHPCGVVSSRDGNWVFVAIMAGGRNGQGQSADGVAVLQKLAGQFQFKRVIPLGDSPFGMVLTHDGKTLIAASDSSIMLLDTSRMMSGAADPLDGKFNDGTDSALYVNVTPDDKVLFVSNERDRSISVVDLARIRSRGFDAGAIVGQIPAGLAPIALTFSPDGRWLYTTSEGALPDWGWPATEKPELPGSAQGGELEVPGAVVVVDVAKARSDPAHSVVARVPAGDSPVRMAISPDGQFVYVTARGSDALLVFDAKKLITDSAHARLATVPVGKSPVPVAVIQDGATVVVGNSNRFSDDGATDTLSVLHVDQKGPHFDAIGNIEAGNFPREMCVSADGRTLFVSNFRSDTLEVIDTRNLPVDPK